MPNRTKTQGQTVTANFSSPLDEAIFHFELLEEKFPFSELEKLYMAVLDRPIDRRNFKKKVIKFGFLEETTEKQALDGAGRPGNLFRFNEQKYFRLQKEGINFEL